MDKMTDDELDQAAAEATEFINGEIDRILPLMEEQIIGAYPGDIVTLTASDVFLLVQALKAQRMFDKIEED